MPRLPDTRLEHLKREVALVRLVEASGIELKRHGKGYLSLCPFHDDKEPLFYWRHIYDKNLTLPTCVGSISS